MDMYIRREDPHARAEASATGDSAECTNGKTLLNKVNEILPEAPVEPHEM